VSNLPVLYTFRRCPYAMRARMALWYAGINCELREVVLRDKPPSMLEYSAKGEVPVLVVDDRVIDESLDVMTWALGQNDPDGWMAPDPEEATELTNRFDAEFKPILDRYKYADRHPERSQVEYRDDALPYLRELDERLGAHAYLMGEELSFADVALFPFIRQFANVDKNWFDGCKFKDLVSWLNGLLESGLFLSIMKKYPQWQAGDDVTFFIEGEVS